MKISLVQMDLDWGEAEANLARAEKAIAANPGADLYVLPEMFTTGFATQADARLDEDPARTVDWMLGIAASGDCAVAATTLKHLWQQSP